MAGDVENMVAVGPVWGLTNALMHRLRPGTGGFSLHITVHANRNHLLVMQAQNTKASAAYRGMFDVFQRTFKHEGLSGFYKGILPNLLKVVPSASITYLVYEAMKKTLSLES